MKACRISAPVVEKNWRYVARHGLRHAVIVRSAKGKPELRYLTDEEWQALSKR